MTAVDCVLEGLRNALEVERELGVRSVEIDRALLEPLIKRESAASPEETPVQEPVARPSPKPAVSSEEVAPARYDYVFLASRPLSPPSREVMAKALAKLGKSESAAPVVTGAAFPPARAYVILGSEARKKYFPDMRSEVSEWHKTTDGKLILVTYSPDRMLMFREPVLSQVKRKFWSDLKSIEPHLALS